LESYLESYKHLISAAMSMTYGQIVTKKGIVKAVSLPIAIIAGLLTIEIVRGRSEC
jgi:hypothetical protein